MNPKFTFFTLLIVLVSAKLSAQSAQGFVDINNDVHKNFHKAYEALDFELFKSIHSTNLIRVGGDWSQILTFEEYMNDQSQRFRQDKEQNLTPTIELRFFERIHNDSLASERGIYKFTIFTGMENERSFYGKFHVLLAKEKGSWKITMDYDSNEGQTIGQEDFKSAKTMHDFESFIGKEQ
ncbi:MAG TPA: hypothetical protein DDX98_00825 [Bacteroidales bacterium]|nr:hypothetical protein [Bacteroidales bacterium]